MLPGTETGSTGTEYCKYKSINTVLNTLNFWMVHQAVCETLRNLVTTIHNNLSHVAISLYMKISLLSLFIYYFQSLRLSATPKYFDTSIA